ncbi:MAG: response regulator [Calothrix sp. MO_167.B12]|nr:response regulator [Calothrix sp. MO_167.B12]
MQGNLREIDIYSILQVIESGQLTGLLFVESCHSTHCKQEMWLIFISNGQIVYATYGDTSLSRLQDYLHLYKGQINLETLDISPADSSTPWNIPEYNCLWQLLANNSIHVSQASSIIHGLVHEILFDLLSLHQGRFIFDSTSLLTPHLTTLEITPILSRVIKQIQDWKQLYPYIQSPEQCLMLADIVQLHSALPPVTMKKLESWADSKTSIRQLARYLNSDIFTFAKAIYPYVEKGWVKIVSLATLNQDEYQLPRELNSKPEKLITCIGNKNYMGQAMKPILEANGYEAIAFTNPLESLGLLFQLRPNLIFCQIAMPELDGYEICSMLRNSTVFREVPIILVTEPNMLFQGIKAKIIGATDYLTVPFGHNDLVMLVKKYLERDMTAKDKQYTQDLLIELKME